MIAIPQRRMSPSRDDFVAAVSATFEALFGLYEAEPVKHVEPAWASDKGAYSVALPLAVANEGMAVHGVASIVKHAVEMGASAINKIARVERDGRWVVYFEVK